MSVRIRLGKGGTLEAIGTLKEVKRRMRDLRPPMRVGAVALTKLIDDSFEEQRHPGGAKWQDIKRKTKKARAKRRRSKSSSTRILIDTGRLRRSWFARVKGRKVIEFGTNVPYGAPHQAGAPKRKIVARRMGPVRLVGTRWELVTTGPAGKYFTTLRRSILDYIRTGRVAWR